MEFRVLGPLEVWDGPRPVDIGPRLPRLLLASLLIEANRVVSQDRLIDQVWGDEPPAKATGALQVYVSNLRRVLEGDRGPGAPHRVLVTRAPGYLLRVEPDALDAVQFDALVAEGRALLSAGQPSAARECLRRALALWRGEPYADVGTEPFILPVAARLGELRAGAEEALMEAELAAGAHAAVVADFERLVTEEPLRERRWELYALALYRCGRQAEALREIARARATLGEVGLEPGAALRHLEHGVLQQAPALDYTSLSEAEGTAPRVATRLPFVGRQNELVRLQAMLDEAVAGQGGLAFVVGEPGMGKTRLVEELADYAVRNGATVLWGHCLESDWAPPYAPFVEAVEAIAETAIPGELRLDLGPGGPSLCQLIPVLQERLPGLPATTPLQPDEERFRLIDTMAQLLTARAGRIPLLLCLEDLHWADRSTVDMLRHLARSARGHPLFVVGTYRGAEVGTGHPLSDALGALRREVEFERLRLEGLEAKSVRELLEALADQDVIGSMAAAIAAETNGNPFFIKELLRQLVEEGRLLQSADNLSRDWPPEDPVAGLGVPEGVREVIDRRLTRLSDDANKLLSVSSVFEGEISLTVAASVAGLDEGAALDALDEALDAELLEPVTRVDAYVFTHALIRHTLAGELNPSRRARLHLRAAEALWSVSGDGNLLAARAGQIAAQYHRAAGVPGAERGVEPALIVAAHAEATGAHDEAARSVQMALDLLPEHDPRRPRLLGRLAIALCWALAFDEAVQVAVEAGEAIAEAEDRGEAAAYFAQVTYVCNLAGGIGPSWELARRGLAFAETHDVGWARMVSFDLERRAAEAPEHPGIPLENPERRESARILREAALDPLGPGPMEIAFDSRDEALTSTNLVVLNLCAGEYARCAPLLRAEAEDAESRGRLARAVRAWSTFSTCQAALGHLDDASDKFERAKLLAARVGRPVAAVFYAEGVLAAALDDGWEELAGSIQPLARSNSPALGWARGLIEANAALCAARLGQPEEALAAVGRLVPWLDLAPAWTLGLPFVAGHAAEVLWLLERLDHLEALERAVRDKVIAPDFRHAMADGRLSLARLCALRGHHDEAISWFAEARVVLRGQGARTLLTVADFDEGLLHLRRGGPGDADRARHLLEAALSQFETLGMTGWSRRAEEQIARLG